MESDSSDEAPEVVSTNAMKSEREREIKELFQQKRQLLEQQKLKRKMKAEKLAIQKKEKEERLKKLMEKDDVLDMEEEEDPIMKKVEKLDEPPKRETTNQDDVKLDKGTKKMARKVYPKYNVVVDPLNKVRNPRATSALNFKERRMAKADREQVAPTLLSYREKLRVKSKV